MKREKTKRIQELVGELQQDFGWMFHEYPTKDRDTLHFRGNRKTGKYTLVPARKIVISVPSGSWLAKQMDDALKAKSKRKKAK